MLTNRDRSLLIVARILLLNKKEYFICHALGEAHRMGYGTKESLLKLHEYIKYSLEGSASLEHWVNKKYGVCMSGDISDIARLTRIKWIDWILECE